MRILEKQEIKSISKVSKFFRKPKRYLSYATIDIEHAYKPRHIEADSAAKTRNPESATVSSQNNLADLVPALNRFKTATAASR